MRCTRSAWRTRTVAEARLSVRACGPLVSYQDGGRFGMLRFGVPASGPMDRLAHARGQTAMALYKLLHRLRLALIDCTRRELANQGRA